MSKHVKDSILKPPLVTDSHEERQRNFLAAQYQEVGTSFRTVWDYYLKFYIAFMALNFTALGLVIQYMDQPHRWPITLCFSIQNILAAGTAWGMAVYSQEAACQQQAILDTCLTDKQTKGGCPIEFKTPIPAKLAEWGAKANAFSQFLFILCWIAATYVGEIKPH